MWGICGVCTLALIVAKTSSHYGRLERVGGSRSKERDPKSELVREQGVSAKKNSRRFGKFFLPKRPPPCFCRNVFCRNVRNSNKVPLEYVSISSSALRPLGAAYIPILLSEVEQEQRPSGNGDREAIVVGAGLCDGEGERAYTAYAPHYDISGS